MTEVKFLKSAKSIKEIPPPDLPEVVLVGRSNVGKSSLINALAHRKNLAKTSKTPGKTRTINFYRFGGEFCLVDLPGYGYARVSQRMRGEWRPLIEGFFGKRDEMALVILVVDLRHEPTALDRQMATWLRHFHFPFCVTATKADKVSRGKRDKHKKIVAETLQVNREEVLLFSSVSGEGKNELFNLIKKNASREGLEFGRS